MIKTWQQFLVTKSRVVLTDKTDYQDKLQKMVDNSTKNGIYKVAEDNTLKDLKLFTSFLHRNFREFQHYKEMHPKSNQPGQLQVLQRHINLPILMK